MRWLALRVRPGRRSARSRPGRILAVKWGLNPNSSSLGVDVTFLLFGAAALSMATPVIGALLRWRKPAAATPGAGPSEEPRDRAQPGAVDGAR
jgi:hypothetical protein